MEMPYTYIATPLDRNFSIVGVWRDRKQSALLHNEVRDRSETWTQVSSMIQLFKNIAN